MLLAGPVILPKQQKASRMTARLSPALQGILWMVLTGLMFVGVNILVKTMGPRLPAPEAAFLRYAIGSLMLLPTMRSALRHTMSLKLKGMFAMRGAVHTLAVILWFYAMVHIPLADMTALNLMPPIYVTLGAALFLGEAFALRRLVAILCALAGALVILRPGFREISAGHIAMLFSSVCMGMSYLTAKRLTDQAPVNLVVVMLSLTVTLGLAPFAIATWVTPTWHEMGLLLGVAALATAGHYSMTIAFRSAPVSITQPVTFLQLVWATLVGITLFGEPLDPLVFLGGGIIVVAVSYISWRESRGKKKPAPVATS